MMNKMIPFLCLFVLCYTQDSEGNKDLDAAIEKVFGRLSPQPTGDKDGKCTTTSGKEGLCVAYYLCESSSEATPTEDSKRANRQVTDVPYACPEAIEICCESKSITSLSSVSIKELD